jgi:predicted nucleic acid-binding Zn ribbon protein
MPTYVYETITETETPECFEFKQSIHDAALTHHPETGKPIRRAIVAANLLTQSGSATPSSSGSCGCGKTGCC